ncbi:cadherin-like domain-containing protein, partial [candidate division KSB1 bacterium]
ATSLDNSYTHATGVQATVTFTTTKQLVSTDEIVIVFPAGFDASGAGIDATTATTGGDPTVEGVVGQIVTLSVPDTWSAGSQTIVLTGIDNPTNPTTGLSLEIKSQSDGAGADIDLPDQTPVTFDINQSYIDLTSTTATNNFTHAMTVTVTAVLTTTTPLVSTNEIAVTFPAGFDVSGAGIDATTVTTGSDPAVEGVAGQVVTLNVPDAWAAGTQIIVLTGISNPTSASTGLNLTVVSQTDGAALALDFADASPATFDINQSYVNLTSTTLSNSFTYAKIVTATAVFTTTTPLVATEEIAITFPAGFDLTGLVLDSTSSFTGISPTVESIAGQVVTLTAPGNLPAGSQTIVLTGIDNPTNPATGLSLEIKSQSDGAGADIDLPDQTPVTFGVFSSSVPVVGTNTGLMLLISESAKITSSHLRITDADNSDPQISLIISFLPANGTLSKSGSAMAANSTFTQSDINNGLIIYSHTGNSAAIDSFLFIATDGIGGFTDTTAFVITISDISVSIDSLSSMIYNEGEKIEFDINVSYNGFNSLEYSLTSNIPNGAGASFNSTTKRFLWNANYHSSGTYTATFTVTDGTISDSETITITVNDVDFNSGVSRADTASVTAGNGGIVRVKNTGTYKKHQVSIPPNALPEDKTIIVGPPSLDDIPENEIEDVPSAVDFKVDGEDSYTFEDSVEITIEFMDFEVSENENKMKVHWWDKDNGKWKRVRSRQTINADSNTVKCKVKHFSIYGVIELSDTSSVASITPGWNMLCMPVIPDDVTDPELCLGDDIYPFRFEEGNSSIYFYNEAAGDWEIPTDLTGGTGYIVYTFFNTDCDIEGLEETSDITHTLTYTNSNGWHLLGNPYAATLDWDSDVTLGSGIDNVYYRWTGNQYEYYPGGGLTSDLGQWEGFFVHTTTDGSTMDITYPGVSKSAGSIIPNIDWRIQLTAESGDNKDTHNYLGTGKDAETGSDGMDIYELVPLESEFISVFFPHEDWEINPANYTQDIRPIREGAVSWDISVMAKSSDNSVTLKWNIPDNIDPEQDVVLTTPAGESIDMRDHSEYKYGIQTQLQKDTDNIPKVNNDPTDFSSLYKSADIDLQKFKVTVGKDLIDDTPPVPEAFYLKQNYPNPFNPETNIEFGLPEAGNVSLKIYNTLGQEVRMLINNDLPAGIHRLKWDGRNNTGNRVATGVYIYRITANNKTQIKKMLLIR